MAVDLADLLRPEGIALVVHEMQEGVVGDASVLPELAEAARPVIGNVALLAKAARSVQVPVVHCLAVRRPDGLGSNTNARLFMAVRKSPVTLEPGSAAAQPVAGIDVEPSDLVLTRLHGLHGMGGTDLDPVLRNMDVRTVVITGVSVNIAILGLAMDAVNNGYRVVLPRDAVAGVPRAYADAVIEHTLSLIATITTTERVLDAWRAG